jgi:hypothetical protein
MVRLNNTTLFKKALQILDEAAVKAVTGSIGLGERDDFFLKINKLRDEFTRLQQESIIPVEIGLSKVLRDVFRIICQSVIAPNQSGNRFNDLGLAFDRRAREYLKDLLSAKGSEVFFTKIGRAEQVFLIDIVFYR